MLQTERERLDIIWALAQRSGATALAMPDVRNRAEKHFAHRDHLRPCEVREFYRQLRATAPHLFCA